MTEKNKTPEEIREEKVAAGQELAAKKLQNKDRRNAVRLFEANWEDLDSIDVAVVLAWVGEGKSKSLEHYDEMPFADLEEVFVGLAA